jgi:23S rRNA pseudouridine2605 synthase
MRLNRFLAAAGVASRRKCDELISTGRVTINGRVCTDFSAQPTERDHVKVKGKLVRTERPMTIVINKPAGFVSTRSDPHARNTIFDLLPPKFPRLFNIGRLDTQSEGLLLLTNDGELAQQLTHPRYKVEKEYEVTLDRQWDSALAPKLLRGIVLDGRRAQISPRASCPSTGTQPPNSQNVLYDRLRSEPARASSNWTSATTQFAARTLAAVDQVGTCRPETKPAV